MKSKCVIFVLLLSGCTQMSIKPENKAKTDSDRVLNSKSIIHVEGFTPGIEDLAVLNAKNYDIIVYDEQ